MQGIGLSGLFRHEWDMKASDVRMNFEGQNPGFGVRACLHSHCSLLPQHAGGIAEWCPAAPALNPKPLSL